MSGNPSLFWGMDTAAADGSMRQATYHTELTLRDLFAGAICQGLFAAVAMRNLSDDQAAKPLLSEETIARSSWRMAEALLKTRDEVVTIAGLDGPEEDR